MKFAFFLGCNIPARVQQYETAARAVLARLGVELADIRDFNCCGYPLRNTDQLAFLVSSGRNLALAERSGLDMLTLCKCCYGSLRKARHTLREDKDLRQEVNRILSREGLQVACTGEIKHLLPLLHRDLGTEKLKAALKGSFRKLNIATHYGCHALRPSVVTQFDDPVSPSLFDQLVEILGAKSVDWPTRLECCGAPLLGINDQVSLNITRQKLQDGKKAGADFLCTACPFCHQQFDTVQKAMLSGNGNTGYLASILYPQLLGICMGIDAESLGIRQNKLDISNIVSFWDTGKEEAKNQL
jgi:heterodisulfide reductase subunit B